MSSSPLYTKIQLPDESPDAIRLIKVFSDLETQSVSCRLETVQLSHAPHYYALSYTWRSPFLRTESGYAPGEEDYTIECNDVEVPVFYNLFHALLHLGQPPFRGEPFWIDRVSIDQENTEERNHQVDLMADIFNSADRVVVWLGPKDEHILPASRLIRRLCELTKEERSAITPQTLASGEVGALLDAELQKKEAWVSLSHLFRRNWFGRAWTCQEILLARSITVLCDDCSLSWEDLGMVSDFLATTLWARAFADPEYVGYDKIMPHHSSPAALMAAKRDLTSKSPFLNSLIRARRHTCQMPIDKVFCLYGIARRTTPTGVTAPHANYDLETHQAFTEAMIHVLRSSEDLHALAYAEGSKFKQVANLPSWVPDWSCREVVGLGVTGYKRYHAASKSPDTESELQSLELYPRTEAPNIIRLKAARIGQVVTCGKSKREVAHSRDLSGWISLLESFADQGLSNEELIEAFWRTIIYDTDHTGECPASGNVGQSFQAWLSVFRTTESNKSSSLSALIYQETTPNYSPELFKQCFGLRQCLRFFRTENFLGLGTESMEVGDTVWIVPGSRVPLIMREHTLSSAGAVTERCELVGATYLHGLMHGEALDGIPSEGVKTPLQFQTVELI